MLSIFIGAAAGAQTTEPTALGFKNVEAACGQCKFAMKGKGCNLAIRVNGKSYFVDNTKIDDHGDAHAEDGFCNKIRKADVTGTIVKDRFVATNFKLLTDEKEIVQ